jgi:ParB family transcriptional regulator, chromosome partitioning protein
MTQKPLQRRGLGRGLGALIPTAPRPDSSTADRAPAEGGDGAGVPGPGSDVLPEQRSHGESGPEDRAEQPAGAVEPTATDGTTSPSETAEMDTQHAADAAGANGLTPGSADWIGVPLPTDERADQSPTAPATELEQETVDQGSPADKEPAEDLLAPVSGAWFAELPVDEIRPNPRQPREVFDEEAMAELVHSIREVGLLQPVVVRPRDDGDYELVMGERRWRATQQAGLSTIPAIVRETSDDDLLRDALLENLHRSELNALEEAAAYQQLLDDFGCTHEELASRIGRSRPQISNTIRLLRLSPAVQRRVAAGVLSAGHARALLAVDDAGAQDRLAGRVVAEGISVRGLEELVAVGELGSPTAPRRSRPTAPGVEDLAARLSDRLETRVRVDLGRRKGRITVEFASLPDLERIVAVIDPDHPTRTHRDADSSL